MLSPHRRAQLGLIAAALVFVGGVSIVLSGSFDKPDLRAGLPGSTAIPFRLPNLHGKLTSLPIERGQVVVLCFASAGQPAEGARPDVKRLAELGERYAGSKHVSLLTVISGSDELMADELPAVRTLADKTGPKCTVLLDPTSNIARRYRVEQTPTFLVIDSANVIRYRGGLDDTSPDAPLASTSFTSMIDMLLAEKPLPGQAAPAVLSNIK